MFFQCIQIRDVLTDDFISNKKYFKNEGEEKPMQYCKIYIYIYKKKRKKKKVQESVT